MYSKLNFNDYSGHDFLLSLETRGIRLGLSRTKKLLLSCNNPEQSVKSVQIIGTNGKGSTASAMSSILQCTGRKVGLYTSPHLVHLNERIQINNQCISNKHINNFINKYKPKINKLSCTFFETLTVLALHYFYTNNVDIAILETGLGGRYDSVTACNPSLQLFTSISKDHTHILGDNIKNIATNKAHAIQDHTPCISVQQKKAVKSILNNFSKKRNTAIDYNIEVFNEHFISPLIGEHQTENLLLAIKASKKLYNIDDKTIIMGIKNISWPGRIQIIKEKPTIIFDVSHNENSIAAFCKAIKKLSIIGKKTLVISLRKTKNINNVTSELLKIFDQIICTQINNKMYTNKELTSIFSSGTNVASTSQPTKLIQNIIKNSQDNDLLAIIGSHYWGKEIEKIFKISLVSNQFKL